MNELVILISVVSAVNSAIIIHVGGVVGRAVITNLFNVVDLGITSERCWALQRPVDSHCT